MSTLDASMSDSEGAVQIVGNQNMVIYFRQLRDQGEPDPSPGLHQYLVTMYRHWQRLPLDHIVADAGKRGEAVRLPALYTPLDAWAQPPEPQRDKRGTGGELADMRPEPGGERPREPALAAVAMHPRCVLIGDPGSGKSTLARFLAVCMAGGMLGEPVDVSTLNRARMPKQDGREDREPAHWPHEALLPIYIELRQFASAESEEKGLFPAPDQPGQASHLRKFLRKRLIEDEGLDESLVQAVVATLNGLDRGAGVLIVLDGLDEVAEANARRVRLKQVIEDVAEMYPAARLLVTSRTYAYQATAEWRLSSEFAVAELAPYSSDQIAFYVRRWYEDAAEHRVAEFPDNLAQEWAQGLVDAIRQDHHLRRLAERPLLLAMMTLLHDFRQGRLPPGGRTALYDETVELLVDRWNREKDEPPLTQDLGLTIDQLNEALEKLAFTVHAQQADPMSSAAADIPLGLLLEALDRVRPANDPRTVDYRDVRRRLHYRAGILVSDSEEVYRFPHRSFQEYLTARALVGYSNDLEMPADAGEPPDLEEGWTYPENLVCLLRREPDRWREVALLAAGHVVRQKKDDAWALIELLTEGDPPDDPTSPLYWGAFIAGQVLLEHGLLPSRPSQRSACERTRRWLAKLLDVGALPPTDRAAAGRTLAVLGDARPGVGLSEGSAPDIKWVTIPAGTFVLGSDPRKDRDAYDEEQPLQRIHLPAFRIGKYPITVEQFRLFVEGDGYTNSDYWTKAGWQWKESRSAPEYWGDPRYGLSNHPVVGVSWYEAYAYCRWLSQELGHKVRLPREAEWEKAARGTDGRIWPWDGPFDATRCNMGDTGIGRTCAVGMFPLPDGPWKDEPDGDPLDMSGNVLEWCATKWLKVYEDYERLEDKDPEGPAARVLRGGAFNLNRRLVRCAYRLRDLPNSRNHNVGFRVAAPS